MTTILTSQFHSSTSPTHQITPTVTHYPVIKPTVNSDLDSGLEVNVMQGPVQSLVHSRFTHIASLRSHLSIRNISTMLY